MLQEAGLDVDAVRARLATIPGDGALCGGGPDAKHESTKACERVGNLVGRRDDVARWDSMHVFNHSVTKSLQSLPWTADLFDTFVKLRNMFGSGQGLAVAEGVVFYLVEQGLAKTKYTAPRAPCGTRMVAYLAGVPERLMANLPWLITALGLRARHRQLKRASRPI